MLSVAAVARLTQVPLIMFAFRLKAGVGRAAHIHVAQPLLLQSERLVQRQQQQLKQLLQLRSSHQASFNRFTGVVAHRTSTTNVDVVRRLMCGHQFGHGPDSPGEERVARSLPPSKFHDVYNFKSVNPNHYLHWVRKWHCPALPCPALHSKNTQRMVCRAALPSYGGSLCLLIVCDY